MDVSPSNINPPTGKPVLFGSALRFWVKLGFINFGGPAGQIAVMHREIVERRGWIGEQPFLRALNFCMLLPGPEAQQLAIYIGWRLHGYAGGFAAGICFVIPSVFIILVLSYLAVTRIDVPAIAAAFYGIQPVVVAVVAEAVLRIGKKALKHHLLYGFAAVAFVAIYVLNLPFPYIIAAAAIGGLVLRPLAPNVFCSGVYMAETAECRLESDRLDNAGNARRSPFYIFRIFLIFFFLWSIVVGSVWAWRGGDNVLVREALFFTRAAFVTFGGAYAVLSYIADFAVGNGWLTPAQMLIGLGLAESTPGPLIMVTQYVGFLGGWHLHADLAPLTAGILGSLVTTYVTFLPCFFFIFAGAPYIEAMAGNQPIQAALTGVTAAVVGVVLNLAVWFGLHILFPDPGRLDLFALILALSAFILLRRLHLPIQWLVPLGAGAGVLWRVFLI